jgi:hypothetical protein
MAWNKAAQPGTQTTRYDDSVRRPLRRVSAEDVLVNGLFGGVVSLLLALGLHSVCMVAAAALSFAFAGAAWINLERDGVRIDRRDAGRCLRCGYNLQGNVSGVCPERGSKR